MAQFQFRLQGVVRLRQRERDAAANSYREALAAKEKLQGQVDELEAEHAAQLPLRSGSSQGRVDPQRILETQRYQMHLMQQVQHLRSQIQLVDVECDKRRLRLVQREQTLRSLEKLRDKQQADWQAEELLREQIALDQWSGFQYWKEAGSS